MFNASFVDVDIEDHKTEMFHLLVDEEKYIRSPAVFFFFFDSDERT